MEISDVSRLLAPQTRPYQLPLCFSLKKDPNEAETVPGVADDDWLFLATSEDPDPAEYLAWEGRDTDQEGSLVTEIQENVVLRLRSLALSHLSAYERSHHVRCISNPTRDLSLLMLGIESLTFPFDSARDSFVIDPHYSLNGITPEVWQSFAAKFVDIGTINRRIHRIVSQEVCTDASSRIYRGFVRGVKQCLKQYGLVVSKLSGKSVFQFSESSSKLVKQIHFLNRICGGVTPSSHSFAVPRGLSLITHILTQTRHVTQQDLNLITISLLNATIKPYLK